MSDRLQEQSTVKKILTWPAKVNKTVSKYRTSVQVLFGSNIYSSYYRGNAHFTVASDKVCETILTQSLVSALFIHQLLTQFYFSPDT